MMNDEWDVPGADLVQFCGSAVLEFGDFVIRRWVFGVRYYFDENKH
jgi:hypothetical protein